MLYGLLHKEINVSVLMNNILLPSAKHLEKRLLWFVRAPTPTLCYMAPHGFIRTPIVTKNRPTTAKGHRGVIRGQP